MQKPCGKPVTPAVGTMTTTVTTQAELDAALAAKAATIYIESDAGVWLTLRDSGSSHVVARGSSHVVAWGSSHVEARGSSHVVAWSSHVVAWSSHVVAWGSSHVLKGGVVIDCTAINEREPRTWCDYHGVKISRGRATLYKALDKDLVAGHRYTSTVYRGTVTADDWRDDNECGGGLHLGPTTSHATDYNRDATRWVAVTVALADIRPILGGTAKCKVRSCRVVREVDRYGKAIK